MRVIYSPLHAGHNASREISLGKSIPAYEVPARASAILAALTGSIAPTAGAEPARRGEPASHAVSPPRKFGVAPIVVVHDPAMHRFLERCWAAWAAAGRSGAIFPDTLLLERYRDGMGPAREPRSVAGAIGYWCFDTATPIVEGTYAAARAAVDVALTTAEVVLDGDRAAYGLCRPPGHHAARSIFGGYCLFNNAAIAAEWLVGQGAGRVGILDVDYHHGNGTQQIFWARGDVPYASLHADPERIYPYFSGHADKTGGGDGAGATLNLPLAAGTTNGEYLAQLEIALEWLVDRTDDLLVVSLGMDTFSQDPIGDLALTTHAYAACGRMVAATGKRLVILQEGGYYLPALGENVRQWLAGVEGP